jgi:hypothetical protein
VLADPEPDAERFGGKKWNLIRKSVTTCVNSLVTPFGFYKKKALLEHQQRKYMALATS